MARAYHFRPAAAAGQDRPFVVLLPGASGLRILDDDGHYFRVAAALQAHGFDALVVDYKTAYRAATDPPGGSAGDKIAFVLRHALAWSTRHGWLRPNARGFVVAWSLGAEGLWHTLPDGATCARLGLCGAVAYYPTNEEDAALRTDLPLLILTGDADDVTPVEAIGDAVEHRPRRDDRVLLRVFRGAHHGFDVSSLPPRKTMRLLPWVGPKVTFGYDRAAAAEAMAELLAFLRRWAPADSSPGEEFGPSHAGDR
ncbi:MAG: dienelactone hydrolase family protein [Planctomycetota bacterium]